MAQWSDKLVSDLDAEVVTEGRVLSLCWVLGTLHLGEPANSSILLGMRDCGKDQVPSLGWNLGRLTGLVLWFPNVPVFWIWCITLLSVFKYLLSSVFSILYIMGAYACIYIWVVSMCGHVHVWAYMWRSEVNIRCLCQSLFTLLLRKGLLLNYAGWPRSSRNLCLYFPECVYGYLPVCLAFMWVLGICISNFSVAMIRYYDPKKLRTSI